MKGRILVHGGAGAWKDEVVREDRAIPALRHAVGAALAAMEGGSAVDAVAEALASLEESGVFNAGKGAYPNLDGDIELDAGLMDGTTLRAGAVAAVRSVPHPIRLARVVLERTENVLVAGAGADQLARRFGLAGTLHPDARCLREFDSKRREYLGAGGHRWARELLDRGRGTGEGDTVGAVAMDGEGKFAAGTTTGGLAFKIPGRVGDSPIVGHGYYAMRDAGAASTSGIGEAISRYGLSLRAVLRLGEGAPAQEAAKEEIAGLTALFGTGTAGIILLDRNGSPGVSFNTGGMAVAFGGEEITPWVRILRKKEMKKFPGILRGELR